MYPQAFFFVLTRPYYCGEHIFPEVMSLKTTRVWIHESSFNKSWGRLALALYRNTFILQALKPFPNNLICKVSNTR